MAMEKALKWLLIFIYGAALVAMIPSASARTLDVGGSRLWSLGTNFADWSRRNGPFRVGDALVFRYGPQHNLYLLRGVNEYNNCDFRGATLLADSSRGSGYQYILSQRKTYYFACGQPGHCMASMKFALAAN